MESIREVITELRPEVLDDYGLVAARTYAAWFSDGTGIANEVRGDDELRCRSSVETALFRIAREALTNAAKHARARRVSVEVYRAAGGVRLVVSGDGVGFEAGAAAAEARGWGLVNMGERARALGGDSMVESVPGRGTRVVVEARSTGS